MKNRDIKRLIRHTRGTGDSTATQDERLTTEELEQLTTVGTAHQRQGARLALALRAFKESPGIDEARLVNAHLIGATRE